MKQVIRALSMSKTFTFPDCGCQFPIISEDPLRIECNLDFNKLPLDCSRTWDLLSTSNLQGIFQLEQGAGRNAAKTLKPKNIEELAVLLAIIRPGSADIKIDGRSLLDIYTARKNGDEAITYEFECLEPILKDTMGVLIFQESCLRIVKEIAGFSLTESESMRKSVGKKDASLMASLKNKFIDGAVKVGQVNNQEEAEAIFGWIEKSQNYSFNKSVLFTTTVETCDGKTKTIDKLEIGEYIKCPNTYAKTEQDMDGDLFVEVLDKFEHGEQEVFEITLESGKQISCTMEHKFLCEDSKTHPLWEILEKNLGILTEN